MFNGLYNLPPGIGTHTFSLISQGRMHAVQLVIQRSIHVFIFSHSHSIISRSTWYPSLLGSQRYGFIWSQIDTHPIEYVAQ